MICICINMSDNMYEILDVNGNKTVLNKHELKEKMLKKQLEVTNLQLSSNMRLVKKRAVYWPLVMKWLIEKYKLDYMARGVCEITKVFVNGNIVGIEQRYMDKAVIDGFKTLINIDNNCNMEIFTVWNRWNQPTREGYRCKNVKATEENIMKYGLVWKMGNKYDFGYVECQRGLGMEVIKGGN